MFILVSIHIDYLEMNMRLKKMYIYVDISNSASLADAKFGRPTKARMAGLAEKPGRRRSLATGLVPYDVGHQPYSSTHPREFF